MAIQSFNRVALHLMLTRTSYLTHVCTLRTPSCYILLLTSLPSRSLFPSRPLPWPLYSPPSAPSMDADVDAGAAAAEDMPASAGTAPTQSKGKKGGLPPMPKVGKSVDRKARLHQMKFTKGPSQSLLPLQCLWDTVHDTQWLPSFTDRPLHVLSRADYVSRKGIILSHDGTCELSPAGHCSTIKPPHSFGHSRNASCLTNPRQYP